MIVLETREGWGRLYLLVSYFSQHLNKRCKLFMAEVSSVQQASFVSDLGAGPVVGNSLFVQVRNRTYPYIVSNVLQGTIAAAGTSGWK
jgi:hypothetical protein